MSMSNADVMLTVETHDQLYLFILCNKILSIYINEHVNKSKYLERFIIIL